MKTHCMQILWIGLFAFLFSPVFGQTLPEVDSTGLPGDHFSLEGTLELFKKAKSIEDFEKQLNSKDNYVNNLDLNQDGQVDYVRVIDNAEGDVHAIVLQVPVSSEESQDIAVIELEKTGPEEAILQILGDEDIFGETLIVEPFDAQENSGGKGGPSDQSTFSRIVVNVFFWPSVRLMYTPTYRPWVSPYRWAYYPRWWRSWQPQPWRVWRPRVVAYKPRYRVVTTHRVVRAHRVYTPKRTYSPSVRTQTVTVKSRKGTTVQKSTTKVTGSKGKEASRSATTLKGKQGRTATKSTSTLEGKQGRTATKSTTTARGKQGKVRGKKSTTTVRGKNGKVRGKKTKKGRKKGNN